MIELRKVVIQMLKEFEMETMFIYGHTIGRSKYPFFNKKNLPIQVTKSMPVTLVYQLLKTCHWLQDIVNNMEY